MPTYLNLDKPMDSNISFSTAQEVQRWLHQHAISGFAHQTCGGPEDGKWVPMYYDDRGVWQIVSPSQMVHCPEW